uniref:Uncharacterized protein n=1 Tax=Arundo donax TaxID=35708 RepID=A0A0A9EH13_ARUDO
MHMRRLRSCQSSSWRYCSHQRPRRFR